nr:T9SS type A sorting domain-containing protein [uncultured Flavobacterium sp.]
MKKIYSLGAILALSFSANAQIVISQVYGGGGNNGSVYSHDFVELYNRGNQTVTLAAGHTLQYASATGAFSDSNIQVLPEISLQPGQYFLIQQAQGNNLTGALPTPDLVPATPLLIGGTNFKIALVSDDVAITAISDATILDFVGVGTANIFEGSGAAPAVSNSLAAVRKSAGAQDTNNNAADFESLTPTPRTTLSVKDNNIAGLKIYPNPASNVVNISSDLLGAKNVEIFDVLGKQVVKTTTEQTVNVANLKAGVYMMKVTQDGKLATRKLVIK